MDFPVWQVLGVSGGFLIALISVIHVFVAQFAVGGGFFLVMVERKAHATASAALFDWVRGHAAVFLLVTMVFGGLTGVGIWLIISLVSPAGTSLLGREFLYAWASEWAFFLGEIIALLLYTMSFDKCRKGEMTPRTHMAFAWAYALFGFLSLLAINGIVSFMLTPGEWLQTRGFWAGLINPTFWPALFFRFFLSLLIAGVFGLISAIRIRDDDLRLDMVRYCAKWLCLPFVLLAGAGVWYYTALPPDVQAAMHRKTADVRPFVRSLLDSAPMLLLACGLLFIRLPRKVYIPLTIIIFTLALVVAGAFEWVRETTRRPWLVRGYMYSNGITIADGQRLNKEGVFACSVWSRMSVLGAMPEPVAPEVRNSILSGKARFSTGGNTLSSMAHKNVISADTLTGAPRRAFGKFLFAQQCSACHGVGGPMTDILPRIAGRGEKGIAAALAGQGVISPYMPPFFGTEAERQILVEWLTSIAPQTK